MGRIVWALIGLNLLVFLLVFSMPQSGQEAAFQALSFSQGTALEIWRWITSLFMHASASHIFFNMLGLYFFGRILEDEISLQWFLSVYFVSGLLGNFVFMLTSTAPVVGASGAMFGIMGAAMLLNPLRKVYLYVFPLPLGIVAVTFVIFESLVVYFQPQEFSQVANIAHVAGILVGSVFALFFDTRKALKSMLVLVICVLLLIFLGPMFSLIATVGGFILGIIEQVIGFFLYNLAGLLSFLWI
jgi:membrane associated rhomboid family serine protease